MPPKMFSLGFFFLSLSFRMYLVGGSRIMSPAGWTMRLLFMRIKCPLSLEGPSMVLALFMSTNFPHYRAVFLPVVARSKMYRWVSLRRLFAALFL